MGPIETKIREKLTAAFQPVHLEIENESDNHSGPPGRESHFKVLVVSAKFEGLARIARQRLVNEILKDELAGRVHALTQRALTPVEWQQGADASFQSPDCKSGSKKQDR